MEKTRKRRREDVNDNKGLKKSKSVVKQKVKKKSNVLVDPVDLNDEKVSVKTIFRLRVCKYFSVAFILFEFLTVFSITLIK